MTRSILRMVMTALALVLMIAGSFNLNRSSANVAPGSKCQDLAGCPGGPITCGTLILDDGTIVKCGKD